MMDSDLAAAYQERCNTSSDINEHLPRLVALCEATNACHVIELGVREGNSTIAFLYGLQHTGGTLTSVDVSPAPDIGVWPRWRYVQGDDLDPTVLEQMDEADIVFVDTVHSFAQTWADLTSYRRFVRKGGYLICHDTELVIGGTKPVTDAINEFCGQMGWTWHNEPKNNGCGEIRVA